MSSKTPTSGCFRALGFWKILLSKFGRVSYFKRLLVSGYGDTMESLVLAETDRDPKTADSLHIGALTIRIGFWGPSYSTYHKEPPKNSIESYLGPCSKSATQRTYSINPSVYTNIPFLSGVRGGQRGSQQKKGRRTGKKNTTITSLLAIGQLLFFLLL